MATKSAEQKIDEQAAARLAEGARLGSEGVAAYDQAKAEVQRARDLALTAAQRDADAIGGRVAGQALGNYIGRPAETYMGALDVGRASYQAAMDLANRANTDYMGQVKAAVPLVVEEARLAHAASQRGGGGGGGGRGRALTDTELRRRLMNAAADLAKQRGAKAMRRYEGASERAEGARTTARQSAIEMRRNASRSGVSPARMRELDRLPPVLPTRNRGFLPGGLPDRATQREMTQAPLLAQHRAAARQVPVFSRIAEQSRGELEQLAQTPVYQLARELAIASGVDPYLVGPDQEDALLSDLNVEDPRRPPEVTMSPLDAARAAGFDWGPEEVQRALSFVVPDPTDETGQRQVPVYQSALAGLQQLAEQGVDFETAAQMVLSDPVAGEQYPRTLQLAIAAARPLFESRLWTEPAAPSSAVPALLGGYAAGG